MPCHFQLNAVWLVYLNFFKSCGNITLFLFMSTFAGAQVGLRTRLWCTYVTFFSCGALTPLWGHVVPFRGFAITLTEHTTFGRTLDEWLTQNGPQPNNTRHSQETNIHACGEIWTHNPSKRVTADPCHKLRGILHTQIYICGLSQK